MKYMKKSERTEGDVTTISYKGRYGKARTTKRSSKFIKYRIYDTKIENGLSDESIYIGEKIISLKRI